MSFDPNPQNEVPLLQAIASTLGVPASAIAGQTEVPLLRLILGGITTVIDNMPSGGGAWGSITGTLSNQTDLQAALTARNPGGSNGQPQYNNAGAFGGFTGLTITGGVLQSADLQAGAVGAPSLTLGSAATGLYARTADRITGAIGGVENFEFAALSLQLKSDFTLNWSAGAIGSSSDLILLRDAANTLGQRNGANAQAFMIYNTFTASNDYERVIMQWFGDEFYFGTTKNGSGSARPILFLTGGANPWTMTSAGHFIGQGAFNLTIGSGGVLQLGNAAVADVAAVSTHYVTWKDSTGTVYKVMCHT